MTSSARRKQLLSAALRHVRDAEHLGEPAQAHTSLDQAFHLAGFGPECVRKAALAGPTFDKVIGHDLAPEAILRTAFALDPGARRYRISGWAAKYPALSQWTPEARYEETGTRLQAMVEPLLREARAAVDAIVIALYCDGRLPGAFRW